MSNINHPTSIDRDYIRLLQAMRRFIREEFTCDIRMTQENAIERLLYFAERSRNHMLQEMGKELQEFVQQLPVVKENNAARVRYYRGAAIVIDEAHNDEETPPPLTREDDPKRIYRGQVIVD